MDHSLTKQLLFDHFSGQLTALQRSRVEAWLGEPANREQYYEWLEEWEHLNLQYLADKDQALSQSLEEIECWEQKKMASPGKHITVWWQPFFNYRLLAAASICLCLLLGGYLSRTFWLYQTVATEYGEIRRVDLPDSSVVVLNTNSSLRFPRFGFGERTRVVDLTGEATFSVKHTRSHRPFIVQTIKGLDVVVLGTEFNVYTRAGNTKVALKKGAVQVLLASQPDRRLLMRPGDLVSVDKTGKLALQHGTRPDLATAWQEHRFIFSQTSMAEIIKLAKENYNLTITLKDSRLADRTVSGTFQARSTEEFLQVIAELLEINYNREKSAVTFF